MVDPLNGTAKAYHTSRKSDLEPIFSDIPEPILSATQIKKTKSNPSDQTIEEWDRMALFAQANEQETSARGGLLLGEQCGPLPYLIGLWLADAADLFIGAADGLWLFS